MAYLIDTNVAIGLRDHEPSTVAKMPTLTDAIVMSIVTRVELEGGVYSKPALSTVRRARLDAILAAIPCIAFDDDAARIYGQIIAGVGYSRRKLLDRMIAAQALLHRATLVTTNAADFQDVPGLKLLAW